MSLDYSDFTLILPTLNEEKTVGKLVTYVLRRYKGMKVIVVDDSSTDGTQEAVKGIGARERRVSLIDRSGMKRGLTASLIDGVKKSRTRYVVVMDADMQHPPELLGEVAKLLREGCDLAVACRSSVPKWSTSRKLISKAYIYLGFLLLSLQGKQTCSDILSGYFGIRKALFTRTYKENKERFVKYGYKVLYDFLKCTEKDSIRMGEVPYVFGSRRGGTSKAGLRQGFALLRSFTS